MAATGPFRTLVSRPALRVRAAHDSDRHRPVAGFAAAMPWLLDLFGGRQSARTLHTVGTVVLVLFVAVHVLEVAAAGFFNKVRSMIVGK